MLYHIDILFVLIFYFSGEREKYEFERVWMWREILEELREEKHDKNVLYKELNN